jgi:putative FmdB family regulatory protein
MPMYDYKCPNGHEFEAIEKLADRAHSTCDCGESADKLMSPVRLDPNMMTPGAMMKWRTNAEKRGRGAHMTQDNRTVADDLTHRNAHAHRADRGENPTYFTTK